MGGRGPVCPYPTGKVVAEDWAMILLLGLRPFAGEEGDCIKGV